jgi:hypothetical protein
MSYWLRTNVYPALGKEAEVRAQASDWVKHWQERGRDIALSAQIYGSEGSVLVVTTRADDLAEIERLRQDEEADADDQAREASLFALLRAPVQRALFESIIAIPVVGPPPGIIRRVSCYPALGKERQMRSILEAHVTTSQQAGLRWGLFTRIYSSDGPVLEATTLDASLTDLDRVRRERGQINAVAAAAVGEWSRAPMQQRLFEAVVPFASP